MQSTEFLRVVSLRKGTLKLTEFQLRPGEKGLSLFARIDDPGPSDVVAAVRAAGKQGELVAAAIRADELRAMGLIVVSAPGGTPVSEINALHVEARLPFWRSILLRLRGRRVHEYFNNCFADRLLRVARILE